MTTEPWQISIHYPNGTVRERYAVHGEADPYEELRGAVECAGAGEAVVLYDHSGTVVKTELLK